MGHGKRHRRHLFILLLRLGYIFAVYRGGIMGGITGQSPWEISAITEWLQGSNNAQIPITGSLTTLSGNTNNLSFASIIDSIGSDITSPSLSGLVDSQMLRERYERERDQTTRSTLVTTLFREGHYDDAYSYMMMGNDAMIRSLPPSQVMIILRNASAVVSHNGIDNQAIMTMLSRLTLSDTENKRHIALISLGQGDKKSFLTQIAGVSFSGNIAGVVNSIRTRLATVQSARDMPSYYEDGMIALSLFENGYIRLAQTLSLSILTRNPQYILPQQILGYSALVAHEWREAAGYFEKLLTSDKSNSTQYQFFRGVSAYRLGEYANALLFFSQIESNQVTSDTIRYMINSYLALDDANGASKMFKSLLSKTDMNNADMMLAREKIIFEPYMYNKDYNILQKDQSLLDLFIARCQGGGFDPTVCSVGMIARDIATRKLSGMTARLRSASDILPRSYLYYILAESLIRDGNRDEAKQMLVKSLSLTNDPLIQETIKKKLQSIL